MFIPAVYFYVMQLLRVLPLRVQLLVTDFIDMGVEIGYDNHDQLP